MAKKSELLEQAKALGLELTEKNTIAEIQAAMDKPNQAGSSKDEASKDTNEATEPMVAKAGKRSAKAIKEAEAKQAKEERKAETKEQEAHKPTTKPQPKTRSLLERRGKKFREAAKQIDSSKEYSLTQALELATTTSTTKFDATIELHIRLNVDPRHADQNIRDSIVLPAGTGKTVRVAAFVDNDAVSVATKAGADISGAEAIIKLLDKSQTDFDVLVATPAMMAQLGKYARLLGPRGLMPNPKSGTVTNDIAKAISEAKAGRVEYRVDSTGIVHMGIGKISFGASKLETNAQALLTSLKAAKPASVKGNYLRSGFVTTTMGPSIRLSNTNLV